MDLLHGIWRQRLLTSFPVSQPQKHSERLDYIDLLRVIALGGVIFFHYFFSGISRGRITSISPSPFFDVAKYGYLGVELFFLISGFVILYSTQNRTAFDFAKRRFFRLYPMYWIAVTFIYLVTIAPWWKFPGDGFGDYALSLTMFPTAFGGEWMDAAHWFLKRELQFYLIVIFFMAVGLGKRLPHIFPIWAITMCVWNLFNLPTYEIWYLNGYFALINGGAIIYCIREWGWNRMRVIGLLAAYVCSIETRIEHAAFLGPWRKTEYSPLIVSVLVTIFFLMMLLLISPAVLKIQLSWATKAGAITFPLFLIHGRVGGTVMQTWGNDENKYFLYLAVLLVMIFIANGLLKIEKRILNSPGILRLRR